MNTQILKIEDPFEESDKLLLASRILKDGGLVAFPTETVYGLGADALNEAAAGKIYAAKGRPSDNPLIVHISNMSMVDKLAEEISEDARRIMNRFWPGPLTVILKKRKAVPDATTGGLNTVAIRMPSHKLAQQLIEISGICIAAPSANTSGRPSPTTADHVMQDMNGRIDMILDGGPVSIGIESTIVDLSEDEPVILRPGYITKTMLEEAIGKKVLIDPVILQKGFCKDQAPKAPGMKYKHYAPKGDLSLVTGSDIDKVVNKIQELADEKTNTGYQVGIIATEETKMCYQNAIVKSIGRRSDEASVAAGLYGVLRDFDDEEVDFIFSESFEQDDFGQAIMNRLLKAAGYQIIAT